MNLYGFLTRLLLLPKERERERESAWCAKQAFPSTKHGPRVKGISRERKRLVNLSLLARVRSDKLIETLDILIVITQPIDANDDCPRSSFLRDWLDIRSQKNFFLAFISCFLLLWWKNSFSTFFAYVRVGFLFVFTSSC